MKLNNKKIIIFFIIVIFVFGNFYFFFSNSTISQKVKSIVPLEIKVLLKNTILYFPNLKKENIILSKENLSLYTKISKLENLTNSANKKFFPSTQFLDLNYIEFPIDLNAETTYDRYGEKVKPFYIDIYKNNLIFVNKENKIFFEKIDNLKNKKFQLQKISSNLPKSEILDILIIDEKIFVALAIFDNQQCFNDKVSIFEANINLKYLNFLEFHIPNSEIELEKFCENKFSPVGGALAYNDKTNDILFSGSQLDNNFESFKSKELNENFLKTNKFASIFSINIDTKNKKVLSVGHRNPLGLLVTYDGNILSTEHGPRGGDEINKIIEGKNYGWPIVSAGEPYVTKPNDIYFYKKNHSKNNFEEPLYSFVPSIGISRIIEIDNNFSDKWQQNYFVSSLRKRSLYRVEFDNKYTKIKSMEEIYVGKRIRDISYSKKKKIFFLALEDKESSLGIIYKK